MHYHGEVINLSKQVPKILSILPKSWETKLDVITKARDLKILIMDELVRNLKTHEHKKQQVQEKR